MVKKGREMMLSTLQFVGDGAIRFLDIVFLRQPRAGQEESGGIERAPFAPRDYSDSSPLDNVGPVPDELRKDPFPGGSVPWSIQEAERERDLVRKTTIWKVAVAVSWLVTVTAALRALGML